MINTNQLPILIRDFARDDVRFTSSLAKVVSTISNEPSSLQKLLDLELDSISNPYLVSKHGLDDGKYCPEVRPYNDENVVALLKATTLAIDLLDCSYKYVELFDHREVHHPLFKNKDSLWRLEKLEFDRHKQKILEMYIADTPVILCVDVKKYFESMGLSAIESVVNFPVLRASHQLKEDFRNSFPYLQNGLPLGYTFSYVLARFGLSQVDFGLAEANLQFTRFQDDIVIGCKDQFDAKVAMEIISSNLPDGVEISFHKSYAYSGKRRKYVAMGIQPGSYALEEREFTFDDISGLDLATGDTSSANPWKPSGGSYTGFDHAKIFHELNLVNGPVPSSSLERANLRGLMFEPILEDISLDLAVARPYLTPLLNDLDAYDHNVVSGPLLIKSIPSGVCQECHKQDAIDVLKDPKMKPVALRKLSRNGLIEWNTPISRRRCSSMLVAGGSYGQINFETSDRSSLAEESGAIQHELEFARISVAAKNRLSIKGSLIVESLCSN